jgi:cell division protein FtsB
MRLATCKMYDLNFKTIVVGLHMKRSALFPIGEPLSHVYFILSKSAFRPRLPMSEAPLPPLRYIHAATKQSADLMVEMNKKLDGVLSVCTALVTSLLTPPTKLLTLKPRLEERTEQLEKKFEKLNKEHEQLKKEHEQLKKEHEKLRKSYNESTDYVLEVCRYHTYLLVYWLTSWF